MGRRCLVLPATLIPCTRPKNISIPLKMCKKMCRKCSPEFSTCTSNAICISPSLPFSLCCLLPNQELVYIMANLCGHTGHLFLSPFAVTPKHGPQITGGQPRYQIGDMVRVNCTSAPSKPVCHLSWLINGMHANRSLLRPYEPRVVGREGLEVARLGLEFRVRG